MDVIIKRGDQRGELLSKYNVFARDFIVDSIPLISDFITIEGRPGAVDYGAEYGQREIRVPFYLKADKRQPMDFNRKRAELFRAFTVKDPLLIRQIRSDVYEGDGGVDDGIVYTVRIRDVISMEQEYRYGFGELVFVTTGLPFAKTIQTIKHVYKDDFTFNNLGSVDIDLLYMDNTTISFQGASDKLKIKNKTTNETWEYDGKTNPGDTILLKGVRATKNSLSIFRDTNKRILTLAPGVNEFEITGATDYEITIKTPFYFL